MRRQREEVECDQCYNRVTLLWGKTKEGTGHDARNSVEAGLQWALNDTLEILPGVQMKIVITE